MFNAVTFNSATFNGAEAGTILKSDAESTLALGDDDVIDLGDEAAERLWINPEGDRPGVSGTFGSSTFNGIPFNGAQRIVGQDWEILADFTDAEATPAISETEQIIQSIVLDLSAPGGSFIREGSLQIDWELNGRAHCRFVSIYPGAAESYYTPRPGHQAQIIDFDGTTDLFAGSIEKVDNRLYFQQDGNHRLETTCEAVGWERIADRRFARTSYTDQDLDVIVADLVSTYLAADGITATGLPTGVAVPGTLTFSLMRISDCFDELSRLTGYWWRIDIDRNVVFFAAGTAVAAPLTITATSANYISLKVSQDLSNYRNKQYLVGIGFSTTERTEFFAGDLQRRTFTTAYPLASAPTITRDGNSQSVAVRDSGDVADWYWSQGSSQIDADEFNPTLEPGAQLAVTYTGQFDTLRSVTKTSEVESRQDIEGGSGVYEAVNSDGAIFTSESSADAYAEALIDRTAPVPSVVRIETDTSGVYPGMLVPITLPKLGLSGNFFVSRVSARDYAGGTRLRFTIDCSSNEPEESWKAALTRKGEAVDRNSLPYNNTDV